MLQMNLHRIFYGLGHGMKNSIPIWIVLGPDAKIVLQKISLLGVIKANYYRQH